MSNRDMSIVMDGGNKSSFFAVAKNNERPVMDFHQFLKHEGELSEGGPGRGGQVNRIEAEKIQRNAQQKY